MSLYRSEVGQHLTDSQGLVHAGSSPSTQLNERAAAARHKTLTT